MGALVINTNLVAAAAGLNLSRNTSLQNKTSNRLSSGLRIVNPSDDAGGLAVAAKLGAVMRRSEAINQNIYNGVSFLQTQDGAMHMAGNILDRISELKILHMDTTKLLADRGNYEIEYTELAKQLAVLANERFSGIPIFGVNAPNNAVLINEDGSQAVTLDPADIAAAVADIVDVTQNPAVVTGLGTLTITQINAAIQLGANMRAANGAAASRLQFASEMLSINKLNLEAAISRITDADMAVESTNLAKYDTLSRAATVMLGQANTSGRLALQLLGQG